jgi:hypothetical protein
MTIGFVMSRPSPWSNSAHIGQIFVKFYIGPGWDGGFTELLQKLKFAYDQTSNSCFT